MGSCLILSSLTSSVYCLLILLQSYQPVTALPESLHTHVRAIAAAVSSACNPLNFPWLLLLSHSGQCSNGTTERTFLAIPSNIKATWPLLISKQPVTLLYFFFISVSRSVCLFLWSLEHVVSEDRHLVNFIQPNISNLRNKTCHVKDIQ